jgi:hypothetical protein
MRHVEGISHMSWTGNSEHANAVQFPEKQEAFKMHMLRNLYGSALPARTQLDKQILSKCVPGPCMHEALRLIMFMCCVSSTM